MKILDYNQRSELNTQELYQTRWTSSRTGKLVSSSWTTKENAVRIAKDALAQDKKDVCLYRGWFAGSAF